MSHLSTTRQPLHRQSCHSCSSFTIPNAFLPPPSEVFTADMARTPRARRAGSTLENSNSKASCTVNQSSRYSLGRCRPGTSHGTPEVVLQQSFPRVRSPGVKKHLAVFHCNQKHSCALRFYFKAGWTLINLNIKVKQCCTTDFRFGPFAPFAPFPPCARTEQDLKKSKGLQLAEKLRNVTKDSHEKILLAADCQDHREGLMEETSTTSIYHAK